MVVLIELVDRSVQLGDKILIFRFDEFFGDESLVTISISLSLFSQSLNTLSYIEKLLTQRPIPIPNSSDPMGSVQYSNVKWVKNKNYCSEHN